MARALGRSLSATAGLARDLHRGDRAGLQVLLKGQKIRLQSPLDALENGIAMIHQELNLADNLDIGANIFLGREPATPLGLVDFARMRRDAKALLETEVLPVLQAMT